MRFHEPRHVMALAADGERFKFYIEMQRNIINQALKHITKVYPIQPNLKLNILRDVHNYLKENLGMVVSQDHLAAMFILYPIDASAIDDIDATDARDSLMDMISHYYVNSYWPGSDDGADDEDWEEVIRKAAVYMHAK